MKNIRKIIIPIIGMLIILIISMNILSQPVQQIKTINGELKAYNHEAENMLDNVFKIDDQIILPFIFKNVDERVTVADVTEDFKEKGLTIKNITTTSIGTGTQITIEESTDIYNVVVYGDITGDGIIGLIDAQRIILNYSDPKTHPIEGLKAIAANVSNATESINLPDAQRIIMFYLEELPTSLVVNEPEENPVIPSTPSEPSTPSTPSTPTKDYITGIEIKAPTTTEYIVGEEIPLSEGTVTINYKQGNKTSYTMKEWKEQSIGTITGDTNQAGTQTITVSYETSNTSNGNSQKFEKTFEITVYEEKNTVNKIELGEGTFIYGTSTQVDIYFYHEYSTSFKKQISDVKYGNIDTSVAETNFEIALLNNGTELSNSASAIVDGISIKPKTINTNKQTLSIIVGEHTENIEINVQAPTLIVGDNSSINLYLTDPQLENTKNEDGTIYTIIPISLNGEGIKATQIDTTNGKIQITDSVEITFGLGAIETVKVYKQDGNNYTEVSTKDDTEIVDYIGIALLPDLSEEELANLTITINYYPRITTGENPAATQTLTVNVIK